MLDDGWWLRNPSVQKNTQFSLACYGWRYHGSEVLPKRTMSRKGSPSSKMSSRKWNVSGQTLENIWKTILRLKGNSIWKMDHSVKPLRCRPTTLTWRHLLCCRKGKIGVFVSKRKTWFMLLGEPTLQQCYPPSGSGGNCIPLGLDCEDGISWAKAMILSRFLMLCKRPPIDPADAQEKLRHRRTSFCTEVLIFGKRYLL